MLRTHEAGTLRADRRRPTVTLAGWVARRRDHGGVAFLDLRDASGVVQVVVREEARRARACATSTASLVTGEVGRRPEGNENPDLPTGEIEVVADRARGAQRSGAAAVPDRRARRGRRGGAAASTATSTCAGRRPAAAIRLRSEVNRAAREVLHEHGFVEIETPTLTRSTPEGARDFLVPGPAAARATGTRCRRPRSCSSSC